MPNGDKIDLSAAAQDQDFLRADMKDKIAYLSAHDQDFAKAPLQDQTDYVNYILGQGKPEPPSAFDRLTSGYNPKLNEFVEKHPAANLLRPFDAAGGMVMGALPAAYQAFMHPIDTAVSTVADLASWMDPNTAKGAPSVLPEALGMGGLMAASGEATGPAGKGLAKRAFTTPEGEATLPTKLLLGKDRASAIADYLNKDKVQAAKAAAERAKSHTEFAKRLSDIEDARQKELADWGKLKEQEATEAAKATPKGESEASVLKERQKRMSAHAEMEKDLAKRAEQRQKELEQQHSEFERRISDAEEARQKEITDWAKLNKVTEADHAAFAKRMGEIEGERQKALADWERFKEQHAQALMRRGRQPVLSQASAPPPVPAAPTTAPTTPSPKTSILSRGSTLVQPGEEPDPSNPTHAKIINDLQTRSGTELRTMAKNGDRFAAFVLRNMPRP